MYHSHALIQSMLLLLPLIDGIVLLASCMHDQSNEPACVFCAGPLMSRSLCSSQQCQQSCIMESLVCYCICSCRNHTLPIVIVKLIVELTEDSVAQHLQRRMCTTMYDAGVCSQGCAAVTVHIQWLQDFVQIAP
jgi:hypothetical protein